ncbi:hypothetical protein FGO68_gene5266 [Halteria grandinella]|uniref:Uncharacterized protein n=1 Tax=Halteria grandinella TaxID=5974 RepID=A0A8J8NJW2_HALGN|nr:hypothetical protein FGO68_gene5266 [Halteria grandinella]
MEFITLQATLPPSVQFFISSYNRSVQSLFRFKSKQLFLSLIKSLQTLPLTFFSLLLMIKGKIPTLLPKSARPRIPPHKFCFLPL